MSHTVTLDNNTSTGVTCQRNGCANICSKPSYVNYYRGSSRIARQYSGNAICDTCKHLCSYSDTNGNLCSQLTLTPGLCIKHKTLLEQLDEYNKWKAALKFHKVYVYVGSHWEKADEDGPIDIYHYLSRDKYDKIIMLNPNFDFTNYWKYDEEIWINDDLWSYCGPHGESKINSKSYPNNFKEQIEAQLLVE